MCMCWGGSRHSSGEWGTSLHPLLPMYLHGSMSPRLLSSLSRLPSLCSGSRQAVGWGEQSVKDIQAIRHDAARGHVLQPCSHASLLLYPKVTDLSRQ